MSLNLMKMVEEVLLNHDLKMHIAQMVFSYACEW